MELKSYVKAKLENKLRMFGCQEFIFNYDGLL